MYQDAPLLGQEELLGSGVHLRSIVDNIPNHYEVHVRIRT